MQSALEKHELFSSLPSPIPLILNASQMGPWEEEVRRCPSPQRKGREEARLRFLGIHSVATGHLCMWDTLCLSFPWVEWQWLSWGKNCLLAQNQHKADLREVWGLGVLASWQLRGIRGLGGALFHLSGLQCSLSDLKPLG